MAFNLPVRFRELRTTTQVSPNASPPQDLYPSHDECSSEAAEQLDNDGWEYILHNGQMYNSNSEATRMPGAPSYFESRDSPPSTQPINVPIPTTEGLDEGRNKYSRLHASRYHEPSQLEQYLEKRRPSITFSPEVTLENGEKTTLEEPLPKLEVKTRLRGRSLLQELAKRPNRYALARAHSETDRADYDPNTGEPLKVVSERQHQEARGNPSTPNRSRYPLLQTTIDLGITSPVTDLEQGASLTSQTTASPITEEIRTPPDGQMDFLISPIVYSPWRHPTSLEESSAWPGPRRQSSTSRAKSYTSSDRSNSLRQKRRQTSRQSTSTSLSPATAFLAKWAREDAVPEPDDEGQEVGDYVLGKEIGFGGFSVVREAHTVSSTGSRLRHAVKIVRKQVRGRDDLENERLQSEFEHEVSLWRCLGHRHVLPLIAVYITDFATFAFTKLNSGGTLFDLVRANRQGLSAPLARRYAFQLASAVRYLHEDVRVVHRDLKLENCLLDLSSPDAASVGGNLLLCDFGLSDFITSDTRAPSPSFEDERPKQQAAMSGSQHSIGPSETSTNIAGSLQYASPELILSPVGLLSTAVDMWAFGVVVFALVVGDLPFQHMFQPRVQMMILAGEWDRDALKRAEGERGWEGEVVELVEACLDMKAERRWDVGRVLDGRWLSGCVEEGEEEEWDAN